MSVSLFWLEVGDRALYVAAGKGAWLSNIAETFIHFNLPCLGCRLFRVLWKFKMYWSSGGLTEFLIHKGQLGS